MQSVWNNHEHRVGEISAVLARAVGWADDQVDLLALAAPMHDVGKFAIPDRILLKPGPLTADERAVMERHTIIGHAKLSGFDSSLLDLAAIIALTHHEWVDATGYPYRLRGDEIPAAGRIVAVADVFDALTNDRVYRPALPLADALDVMRNGRGSQFDPVLIDVFLERLADVLPIKERSSADAHVGSNPAMDTSKADDLRSLIEAGAAGA